MDGSSIPTMDVYKFVSSISGDVRVGSNCSPDSSGFSGVEYKDSAGFFAINGSDVYRRFGKLSVIHMFSQLGIEKYSSIDIINVLSDTLVTRLEYYCNFLKWIIDCYGINSKILDHDWVLTENKSYCDERSPVMNMYDENSDNEEKFEEHLEKFMGEDFGGKTLYFSKIIKNFLNFQTRGSNTLFFNELVCYLKSQCFWMKSLDKMTNESLLQYSHDHTKRVLPPKALLTLFQTMPSTGTEDTIEKSPDGDENMQKGSKVKEEVLVFPKSLGALDDLVDFLPKISLNSSYMSRNGAQVLRSENTRARLTLSKLKSMFHLDNPILSTCNRNYNAEHNNIARFLLSETSYKNRCNYVDEPQVIGSKCDYKRYLTKQKFPYINIEEFVRSNSSLLEDIKTFKNFFSKHEVLHNTDKMTNHNCSVENITLADFELTVPCMYTTISLFSRLSGCYKEDSGFLSNYFFSYPISYDYGVKIPKNEGKSYHCTSNPSNLVLYNNKVLHNSQHIGERGLNNFVFYSLYREPLFLSHTQDRSGELPLMVVSSKNINGGVFITLSSTSIGSMSMLESLYDTSTKYFGKLLSRNWFNDIISAYKYVKNMQEDDTCYLAYVRFKMSKGDTKRKSIRRLTLSLSDRNSRNRHGAGSSQKGGNTHSMNEEDSFEGLANPNPSKKRTSSGTDHSDTVSNKKIPKVVLKLHQPNQEERSNCDKIKIKLNLKEKPRIKIDMNKIKPFSDKDEKSQDRPAETRENLKIIIKL